MDSKDRKVTDAFAKHVFASTSQNFFAPFPAALFGGNALPVRGQPEKPEAAAPQNAARENTLPPFFFFFS